MSSKTEEYLALAQRTANGLTRYWESWTAYLTTASRLYKYPFADLLMIYAQRPDATAAERRSSTGPGNCTCTAGMLWSGSPSSFPSTVSDRLPCAGQGRDIPRFCLAFWPPFSDFRV